MIGLLQVDGKYPNLALMFLVGTTAFGLSQVIHGARDLRAKDRA